MGRYRYRVRRSAQERKRLSTLPDGRPSRAWRILLLSLVALGALSGGVRWAAAGSAPASPVAAPALRILEVSGRLPDGDGPVSFHFPEVPLTISRPRAEVPVDGNKEFHAWFELELERTPTRVLVSVGDKVSEETTLHAP